MTTPFRYSRHGLSSSEERRLQRFLEIVPGTLSWTVLIGLVGLCVTAPMVAAALIIAFYLYWLLRVFYLTVFLVLSSLRLAWESQTDWMARATALNDLPGYVRALQHAPRPSRRGERVSQWVHRQEVEALWRSGALPPRLEEIYHLVIFPVAREGRQVYEAGVRSLLAQEFPARRMLVVLAVEGRAGASAHTDAQAVRAQYRQHFLDVLVVVHPDGQVGEMAASCPIEHGAPSSVAD